jgi:segregation and condensation protein B
MSMNETELKAAVEAIIYAADEPVSVEQIARTLDAERPAVRNAIAQLVAETQTDARGVEVREVAGGYKFFTKPHHHEVVRKYIKSLQPPLRLSMPALETLAVIAYRQPVTLPEINEIRGVNCSGVIETLLDRRLITTAGRKQVIGRPILYRTTKEFLMRFGLGDVSDLPSLKEFEELARQALGADAGIEMEEAASPGDEPHPLVDRTAVGEAGESVEKPAAAGDSAS